MIRDGGGLHRDAATVGPFYDMVARSSSRSLAVVGLVKNAGKTTAVNALLANCPQRFGLTSLGLDGEHTDHLTGLVKPSISPPAGTLVATTQGSLIRSRYRMDVLEELPFQTPLGRVVIGQAAGEGAIEVSGPTTLAELRLTVDRLLALGAGQVLIDGAINRIGSASPRVSDGVIVATGGMVGDTLDDVLETTVGALDLLTLPEVDPRTRKLVERHSSAARAVAFTADGAAHPLELSTVVGEGVAVARVVERLAATTLLVDGALTRDFVDDLVRVLPPRMELTVVVRDATVLVLPPAMVRRCLRRGVHIETLTPLQVLALTVNPFRVPHPYQPRVFFSAVVDAVGERVPVFDVVNGLAWPRRAEAATSPPSPPDESG